MTESAFSRGVFSIFSCLLMKSLFAVLSLILLLSFFLCAIYQLLHQTKSLIINSAQFIYFNNSLRIIVLLILSWIILPDKSQSSPSPSNNTFSRIPLDLNTITNHSRRIFYPFSCLSPLFSLIVTTVLIHLRIHTINSHIAL